MNAGPKQSGIPRRDFESFCCSVCRRKKQIAFELGRVSRVNTISSYAILVEKAGVFGLVFLLESSWTTSTLAVLLGPNYMYRFWITLGPQPTASIIPVHLQADLPACRFLFDRTIRLIIYHELDIPLPMNSPSAHVFVPCT
jgi:hypothetical protein